MTIKEIISQNFAQVVWARRGEEYISVRPIAYSGQEVVCDMGNGKIWVNVTDLSTTLNGNRIGVVGQRRDEHGMPFVAKAEAIEEGRGLFE